MKIVLLGPPGCGKGTQAVSIAQHYNIPHISTGEIFRDNINGKTPIGLKIKEIIDKGNLCPDSLTIEIVKDRLRREDCANGYLLDGFPRNLLQAEALDGFSAPDKVINFSIELEKIERRIIGRRSCPKCGGTYHVDYIGDTKECPACGENLVIRKDDNPEVVKERLRVYKELTEPLIEYYNRQDKVFDINADNSIENVFEDIKKVLG